MRKTVVGVMGASANEGVVEAEKARLKEIAERLGGAIAQHGCLLVTGATTGLPDMVSRAFREQGGFAIGISPALNWKDHLHHRLPDDGVDAIIFTGFGYKGRNVINVRSADIVLIFGGATGTLNEFTIAYDEGKVIGVIEETGGIADHLREIIGFFNKPTQGVVLFDKDPERLLLRCVQAFRAGG